MPPPAVSPDQILDYAPRGNRILSMDANVIAYFGDFFSAFRQNVAAVAAAAQTTSGLGKPSRKDPKCTAFSQNQS